MNKTALKSAEVIPAARQAIRQQMARLETWAAKAKPGQESQINRRAEELEAITLLLDYTEQLQSNVIQIGEDAYREGFCFAKSIYDTEDFLQPIVSMITGDHLKDGKWSHTPPPYVLTPNPAHKA